MIGRGARVSLDGEAGEARVLVPAGEREPLTLDLRAHAGRTVTLRIQAEEAAGVAPLIFETPRVEIALARARAPGKAS
jgi:hypothetical protein